MFLNEDRCFSTGGREKKKKKEESAQQKIQRLLLEREVDLYFYF